MLLVHGGMGSIDSWQPVWAALAAVPPAATVTGLPGVGHDGLDRAPDLVLAAVRRFLGDEQARRQSLPVAE